MKYFISILLLFAALHINAQNIVKMSAVKANNYGVAYALPKTSLVIKAYYTKTSYKSGDFYQFAERYLKISNPIAKDNIVYTLDKIETSTKSIVDPEKRYLLEFKPNTTAPFVTLTKDGILCAINADYAFPNQDVEKPQVERPQAKPRSAYSYLSEEILRAGSTAKQAELIAKQIFHLRETRNNILTGEADAMPPDGEAYKLVMNQLDEQEKALTSLFAGSENVEQGEVVFDIVPEDDTMMDHILLRFSSKLGIVDADDLSGTPVYFTLLNKEPKEPKELTAKEEQAMALKFSKGIIYNIPGRASFQVSYNGKTLIQREYDIVQYGTQEVLAPKMFDNNKQPIKVLFYPELGKVKQIIQ